MKFQGNFFEDKKEGVGFLHYPNGDYYYGEFINDKKEGVVRQYYKSDGDKIYEGEWSKDERNGEGYLINSCEGFIVKGNWR